MPTDEEGSKCGVRIRTGGRASYTRPSMHARGTWTHRWKASSARPVQKIGTRLTIPNGATWAVTLKYIGVVRGPR